MSGPLGVAGDQLRAIVERIEHVEEEIKELTDAKKEIYLEAKSNGFDVKIIREVIRLPNRTPRSATHWRRSLKNIGKQSSKRPRQERKPPDCRSPTVLALPAPRQPSQCGPDGDVHRRARALCQNRGNVRI